MTASTTDAPAVPADISLPPPAEYPYDLGTYEWKVQTSSPETARWFQRALNWTYGFHHDEAVRCYRYALHHDPDFAMGYWGVAYASGPNYNKPWELFDKAELRATLALCHAASKRAVELAKDPLEKKLCEAIAARFPSSRAEEGGEKEFARWNQAFADRMGEVYEGHRDDLDVTTVFADSLMGLAAWDLWDLQTVQTDISGQPREVSQTLRVKEALDVALKRPEALRHPGILHFYIHLMELSPTPELALVPADALRGLVPDSGHLTHMSGHIYAVVGDYRAMIASNFEALTADEKYMAHAGADSFYMFYILHDYTFPIYAAMFNGQLNVALKTLDRMEAWLTDEFLRIESPPMIDWMEGFCTFRVHVLVRFGKWDDILALPFPEDREFYCVTTAFLHYGRALAYALTDRHAEAEKEQQEFRAARARVKPSRQAIPNTWSDIFDVADAMLAGEMAYRAQRYEEAFELLRLSIHRCDNLVYAEPWGFMQPPRHAYAALQLEQGHVEEAARAYAEDLGFLTTLPRATRHPNNVWALHGYHECLTRLGRQAEADMLKPELTLALAVADVPIESSCYCRKTACCSSQSKL